MALSGKNRRPGTEKFQQMDETDPVAKKLAENKPSVRMDENFSKGLKNELMAEFSRIRKSRPENATSRLPRWRGMFAGLAGALAVVAIVGVTVFINRDNFIRHKPAIIEEQAAYDNKPAPAVEREKAELKNADSKMKQAPVRSESLPQGGNEKETAGPAPENRMKADVQRSPAPEKSGELDESLGLSTDKVSAESSGTFAKKSLSASFKDDSANVVRPVKNLDEICDYWVPVRGEFSAADTVLFAISNQVVSYYSYARGSLTGRGQLFMKDRSVYMIPEGNMRTNVYSNIALSNNYLYLFRSGGQFDLFKKKGN